MKKDDYQMWATKILSNVGGTNNVKTCMHCMTRLRITPCDMNLVNFQGLADLDFVIKVQEVQGICQVVIGPGKVNHVYQEFERLTNPVNDDLNVNKVKIGTKVVNFMQAVMMPAIGAIISVALINALLTICQLFGFDPVNYQILNAFKIFANIATASLSVLFAVNTTKYFKGNTYISMLIAVFLVSPDISQISFGQVELIPGIGGIFSAMLMGLMVATIEKKLKKIIPDAIELLIVPLFTTIVTLLLVFIIIIPVGGFIMKILMDFFTYVVNGNELIFIVASIMLGFTYPLLVLSGLHISIFVILMPIYMETGEMPLIASALLGGAAQLGTATAVYIKERKNQNLTEIFTAGAPSAFLGVIEPLMYGINLPRVKPLIIACICAGIGGLAIGITGLTMNYALAGLIGIFSFDTFNEMILYAGIWIGTTLLALVTCYLLYQVPTQNKKEELK